ncbi:hypothetical protein FH972_013317 [Carpinus fangiana]|uniref:Uncharacterized protein n=1 Tax=Carpinus fangiana TaxID=176857 RepID=A0A5N6R6B2_9ROSI|nr:hypothetical protein FH972_013317 [Carpinus fangiana]
MGAALLHRAQPTPIKSRTYTSGADRLYDVSICEEEKDGRLKKIDGGGLVTTCSIEIQLWRPIASSESIIAASTPRRTVAVAHPVVFFPLSPSIANGFEAGFQFVDLSPARFGTSRGGKAFTIRIFPSSNESEGERTARKSLDDKGLEKSVFDLESYNASDSDSDELKCDSYVDPIILHIENN